MKTNTKQQIILGLTFGALALSGCAKSTSGNNSTAKITTSFAMAASSGPRTVAFKTPLERFVDLLMPSALALVPPTLVDAANTSVSLDKAWIIVKEVEFKGGQTTSEDDSSESGEEISFNGPYFVDLLSAQVQTLDTQSISAKTIKRIQMKLEPAEDNSSALWPANAPTELQNNSMYLHGTFGASSTPFSFASHDGAEIQVSGANGIAPQDGQNLLMSVNFGDIIRKVDMTLLATAQSANISETNRVAENPPTANGLCPTIETGLHDLYTCFRKGLESESKIGNDADGDGDLESDEDRADN